MRISVLVLRPSSVRPADLRFLLPVVPRSAAVFGPLDDLAQALSAVGVNLGAPNEVDVVFAAVGHEPLVGALPTSTPIVIVGVHGYGARRAARGGRDARRLVVLPDVGAPQLIIDPSHRFAASYAVGRREVRVGTVQRAKQLIGAAAFALGAPPSLRDEILILPRPSSAPAPVVAAIQSGCVPNGVGWFAVFDLGSDRKRIIFMLFEPRRRLPFAVLKLGRTKSPQMRAAFDRDELGLAFAAAAPAVVAERAPRLLARRIDVAGHPASVETAAVGTPLSAILRRGDRRRGADSACAVAAWLAEVASITGRTVDGTRSVFEHGDLSDGNVIVGRNRFMVVDWELARPNGRPLWDLLYFALCTLPLLEGARTVREQATTALAVLEGSAASSRLLAGWVNDQRRHVSLSDDDVERVAGDLWAHRVELVRWSRQEDLGWHEGAHPVELLQPMWAERAGRIRWRGLGL